MRLFATLSCLFVLALTRAGFAAAPTIAIIPAPSSVQTLSGTTVIDQRTAILANEGTLETASFLRIMIKRGTGMDLAVKSGATRQSGPTIRLSLTKLPAASLEAYRLTVKDGQVIIEASDQKGLFYGVQSLIQLMPPRIYGKLDAGQMALRLEIPNLVVKDEPRFERRGLLVDLSRHFFGKDTLLKLLDGMAMHKMNVLHLHLSDDNGWRVQIDAFPKLVTEGSKGNKTEPKSEMRYFLSKDDVREIVTHAAMLHIEVVPEVDMPGHSSAATRAYPEYDGGGGTLNPGAPGNFEFVSKILTEIMDMFPSRYIHFGGDQVDTDNWKNRPEITAFMKQHGYTDLRQVEAHYARFMTNFILARGRIPVGWDEIAKLDVDKQAVVQWWRGSEPAPQSGVTLGRGYEAGARDMALSKGHQLIMSPDTIVYFDYAQGFGEPGCPWEGSATGPHTLELIYNWEPVPSHFTAEQEKQVIGVEAALWTEFIKTPEYLEFMTYPRLSSLAEAAWSPKGAKDLDGFKKRMDTQYLRYQAMGINYRLPDAYPNAYMVH